MILRVNPLTAHSRIAFTVVRIDGGGMKFIIIPLLPLMLEEGSEVVVPADGVFCYGGLVAPLLALLFF